MNKSVQSEIEGFRRQLSLYGVIIKRNKNRLENDPWLERQIAFWMESLRFLLKELEIWDQVGNQTKCQDVIDKTQKAADHLHELIRQLD